MEELESMYLPAMERVGKMDWIIVAALMLAVAALAGFVVLESHDDTCPDGTPHTGFSCGTGTDVETPGTLPGSEPASEPLPPKPRTSGVVSIERRKGSTLYVFQADDPEMFLEEKMGAVLKRVRMKERRPVVVRLLDADGRYVTRMSSP